MGPDKDSFVRLKLHLFPYSSILTCVLGAQKNRLIETVLLSTHSTSFGYIIRKIIFQYTLLSGGLYITISIHLTKVHEISTEYTSQFLLSEYIVVILVNI